MAQPNISVLAHLQQVQRPPSGIRRTETRYQCGPATPGRVIIDPGTEPVLAWILTLSFHGIGLLLDGFIEAKTEITISLKSLTTERAFQLNARICHCTKLVSGDWLLGCELLTPLSDDDLDELL